MKDNLSAFHSTEYDRKIIQTMPYYDEFYKQVIELVKTIYSNPVSWLDIGCGTGRMAGAAFESIKIERFVFTDSSEGMIKAAKKQFERRNTEFSVLDVRDLSYENEFDVVSAVLVNHFLKPEERQAALQRMYTALKENGILVSFENIAPFTEIGKEVSLEKWKRYQIEKGKSMEEADRHIARFGKEYFPLTIERHLSDLRKCGFRAVEVLWYSNMQAGFWAMK